jgi:hypothetical protein
MRQGCCVLPADESGRILDRLAMLEKFITPAVIRQVLAWAGRINVRACKLSHEVMMWVVLAMGIFTDMPIRQVFRLSRRLRPGEKTPVRSALCMARRRLGVEPVRELFRQVVRPLATPQTPGALFDGMPLFAIDGTVLDVPDTPANDVAFGRPSGGDRGDGAFPQLRKLSLVEVGTHVEVAFAVGTYRTSEQALLPQLWSSVPPGALLLWDRNFFSYDRWNEAISRGIHLLVRLQAGMILKPLQRLSDGSYLAKIYPTPYARQKDRDGIVVRVIRYTLDDPLRAGHGEEHTLLTDLLDHRCYPAMVLIPEYHERWENELTYDEQKAHQDPRRITKPAHLRSETPAGVLQELYAVSLAHFVIRSFMVSAAATAGLDPDRLSFTGCFQILKCRLPECMVTGETSLEAWLDAVLAEMVQECLPPRRNRVNPRVIKRKLSKWAKKRPEHCRPPPLTKPFPACVVMAN